jgi:hypothetical protein
MMKGLLAAAVLASSVSGEVGDVTMNIMIQQRLSDLRSADGARSLGETWRQVAAGGLLGVHAFNERNPEFTPALADYTDCEVQITPHMYDSQSTGKGAVMAYREAMADAESGSYDIHGILGPARSDASKPMNILGGIDEVPAVSYWSTSDSFDSSHGNYPYFSRTIPADSAVAKAAAEFFKSHGHKTIGVAYLEDAYGEAYKSALVTFCFELGITVQAQSFQVIDGSDAQIKKAVDNLQVSGIRVGIIILSDEFNQFFDYAAEKGMTGPGNLWILSEAITNDFIKGKESEGEDAMAIVNGMGTLLSQGGVPGLKEYDEWLAEWATLTRGNPKFDYVDTHMIDQTTDAGWGAGADLSLSDFADDWFETNSNVYDVSTYAYDGAIVLGMAACDLLADGGSLSATSGVALYDKIKALDFKSITGNVKFDGTGSRLASTGNYMLYNHQVNNGKVSSPAAGVWTASSGWTYFNDDPEKGDSDSLTTPILLLPMLRSPSRN